jgi:hypothetical protein
MCRSQRAGQWPVACLYGLAILCGAVAGCTKPPAPAAKPVAATHDHDHDHDHDDHHAKAETLGEGVAELSKVIAAAKQALADKDFDDADGHVHMVGHLVDDLHRLVAGGKLPTEAEAAAKKALDDVFECFDALDTKLHAADESVRGTIDYAEHEPRIEAAMKTLATLAAPAKAEGTPATSGDVDE